jgi:hypothetical protein
VPLSLIHRSLALSFDFYSNLYINYIKLLRKGGLFFYFRLLFLFNLKYSAVEIDHPSN